MFVVDYVKISLAFADPSFGYICSYVQSVGRNQRGSDDDLIITSAVYTV
jgi:hypothetical protein